MTLAIASGHDVQLLGWAHSRFGKLANETLESLVVTTGRDAIAAAGMDVADIDEVVIGTYNAGLVPLGFASSLALQIGDGLRGKPATRVENACASGSAAVQQAVKSVLAGTARRVLVVGVEKMTQASSADVGRALLGASYELAGTSSATGFAGLFAEVADAYVDAHGDVGDALAAIAAKNHRNGTANRFAHLRKDLGFEFCRTVSPANPIVAGLLRRTDCSPVSDGAAAVVIGLPGPRASVPPVRLLGFAHANDYLPSARRDPLAFEGSAAAWNQALSMAGVGLDDLDLIELHDCFTIAELLLYEVIGLCGRGEGIALALSGDLEPGGPTPVNVSGGLKAKGHPVGATGVSQHVMAAMQLSGTAGDMQLQAPRRAAIHNMGGVGVANYVSIVEAT